MNEISTKIGVNRRRFIMGGIAFLAALHLPKPAGVQTQTGKLYSLGDGYFAVNGWVVKKEDLA